MTGRLSLAPPAALVWRLALASALFLLLLMPACAKPQPPRPQGFVEGTWATTDAGSVMRTDTGVDVCPVGSDGVEAYPGLTLGAYVTDESCELVNPVTAVWSEILESAAAQRVDSSVELVWNQVQEPRADGRRWTFATEVPSSYLETLHATQPRSRARVFLMDGTWSDGPGDLLSDPQGWRPLEGNGITLVASSNSFAENARSEASAVERVFTEIGQIEERVRDAHHRLFGGNGEGDPAAALDLNVALTDLERTIDSNIDELPAPLIPAVNRLGEATLRQLDDGDLQAFAYENGLRRSPAFYRGVAKAAECVVVVKRGQQRVGSGFLIHPNWVVTNKHVVGSSEFVDLKVEFDYEKDEEGNQLAGATECDVVDGKDQQDYSLDIAALEISCPATFSTSERVLRLADEWAMTGQLLYVVGHPSGSFQSVADNGRVRFPPRVSVSRFDGWKQKIELEWQADFEATYDQIDSGFRYYRIYGSRFDHLPDAVRMPDFGFDSDTEQGFSGGAVLSAISHYALGLFFGGASDAHVRAPVTWRRHEHAVPSVRVREWLDREQIPYGVPVP